MTSKYFLKAFKRIEPQKSNPEIAEKVFELHFVGHFRRENEKLIKKYNLHRFVQIHGYMNHSDVLQKIIYQRIFLWVISCGVRGREKKNMNTVSAGKLYEYFGAKKLILATVPEGASYNSAKEYKASIITSPENIDEIKKCFNQRFMNYLKMERNSENRI